jgi:hypothetical protein
MARADLIESMAKFLRDLKVDLNDERAVFRALASLHFLHGDIVAFSDEAVKLARGEAVTPRPPSIIGDSVIAIFAGAVWLAWYLVLCPAVS